MLSLFFRPDLRDDDDQAGVNRFFGIELPEVLSVVGDEGEILIDNEGHEVPVGFAA